MGFDYIYIGYKMYLFINKPMEAFIHDMNFLPEVHSNTVTVAAATHYSSQTLST